MIRKNNKFSLLQLFICCILFLLLSSGCGSSGSSNSVNPEDIFDGIFDSTGEWSGSYKINALNSTKSFSMTLTQNNTDISGTITIYFLDLEDVPITGTVSGNIMQFHNSDNSISFTGAATVFDTASGTYTVQYNGSPYSGAWNAICVRQLNLVKSISITDSSHRGIAWDGSGLFYSDGQMVYRIDTDGNVTNSFIYNGDGSNEYHDFDSLCWDGGVLWAVEDPIESDYTKSMFRKIDKTSGAVTESIPCPPDGTSPSIAGPIGLGLGWDGSNLWCFRYTDDGGIIYRIDPSNGSILGTLNVPEDSDGYPVSAGGFTAHESCLYISDRSGVIYKVRTDGKILRRYTASIDDMSGLTLNESYLWVRDTFAGSINCYTMPTGLIE